MHLSRPDVADTEAARRRLEMLTHGADADAVVSDDTRGPHVDEGAEPEPCAPGRHAARGISSRDRLTARLLDALPPTLRGRWGVTAHHVTVLALLVASAVALAAWWLLRAQPEPLTAMTVSEGPASHEPTAAPEGAGAEDPDAQDPGVEDAVAAQHDDEPAELVVHVAGKVRKPGIVTVPAGARVIEALREAGGPRKGVDLSSLNLARALSDGEQIVVGIEAPPAQAGPPGGASGLGGEAGAGGPTGPVNLNTATNAELEELPGVGPVTAASIIDWREEHGRFSTVEELLEVSGIGDATLADLRDLVTV